jgi:predicted nucleotidyltransferase
MHKLGFPRKLVNLCKVLHKEVYAVVKIGKQISEDFKLGKGLRQDDAIAPLLFNIVLEIAIQQSNIGTQGTIFNKCSQTMEYADDIVIMGRRIQDVKETFTALIEQTSKLGLEINLKKTKFMTVPRRPFQVNQQIEIGTYSLK